VSQKKDTTQPTIIVSTIVVWFQKFLVQILLSEYAIESWFLIYHLTCLMYRCIVTYLPLGNFTTLKIMNLASNCRYPNQYDWIDLCLPWNESQQPILPRSLTLLADAASYQAYCRWYMFVFQQENAPSHHAKDTIKLLQQEVLDFIGPDLWPPNSLDLNPVDYKVCGVMQQRVYETVNVVWTVLMSWSSTLLKSGKSAAECYWHGINEWRKRLRAIKKSMRVCRWTTFWTFIVSACD